MRETFESLGSTYIKLGQFIASTPSLFPREYVEEFQGCLDQTPYLPFSYVQEVLEQEFAGRNLSEIFASIDEKPLASASIAQVHAAKLVTGEDVVIKVQKTRCRNYSLYRFKCIALGNKGVRKSDSKSKIRFIGRYC